MMVDRLLNNFKKIGEAIFSLFYQPIEDYKEQKKAIYTRALYRSLIVRNDVNMRDFLRFMVKNTDDELRRKYEERMKSILTDRCELVKGFIDNGADVNVQDDEGVTPLMWACFRGEENIVKLLIESGAEPDTQSKNGWTALMEASRNASVEAIEYLAEIANMDLKNKYDMNVFDIAEEQYQKSANDVKREYYKKTFETLKRVSLEKKLDNMVVQNDGEVGFGF